jgi:hypothetical protein
MKANSRKLIKAVSIITMIVFTWTFGGVFEIAQAITSDQQSAPSGQQAKSSAQQSAFSSQPKTQKPVAPGDSPRREEKFQKTIEDIERIISDQQSAFSDQQKTKENKERLKGKRTEIEALDIEIKKQFKETEEKIKDLPEVIQQRHRDFVKRYDENLNTLRTNLDDIDKAKTKEETDAAIAKTNAHLEKTKPPKKKSTLDPNKLPNRVEEPIFKEPRTKPEEFLIDSQKSVFKSHKVKPILLAMNGEATGLLSSPIPESQKPEPMLFAAANSLPPGSYQIALANPPTDADLAETIEVQFTPEIQAKAAELGHNPVKIYNWVRNNIEYVPTYGSIQGANMCLQTKQCNDMDTGSLLIALFRTSGIHAKYVYGTIELPIEKVKNWAGGFTDSMAAINIMATGGIPIGGITEGGQVVRARLEHMWVEAWIDYTPSRGARHKTGDMWIPLDASFKNHDFKQGIDIAYAVPFDSTELANSLVNSATINKEEGWVTGIDGTLATTAVADYRGRIEAYMTQNNQNATVEDVVGSTKIIKQEFPILMGTLPYKTVARGASYSEIPDSLRYKLRFTVENSDIYGDAGSLDITYSLPQIAGKKITVSYASATAADEAVINSYLPKPHSDGTPIQFGELPASLPAYLINLKPELRIDGQVVAKGDTVTMGSVGKLNMTFINPARRSDIVLNTIVAGEYWGIAVGVSWLSAEVMKVAQDRMLRTKTKLESNDFTGLTSDDILGEMLYYTAMLYEARMDGHNTVLARSLGVKAVRLPSEAVFKSTLQVNCIFNVPVSASAGGLIMDVGRQLSLVKAYDGDNSKKLEFMRYSGINSSVFEHRVPEQLLSFASAEGISAVKALQIANDARIPIYTITQDNVNVVLPQLQLDPAVIDDIRNAVSSGKEVTVSKTNISFRGWVGCGYVITDPNTGNGAFMISGEQRGAYILITAIGILTGNPVVITAGLGLLSGDILACSAVDFAKFAGIGATEPKDWCGSKGSEWVPDYPFGIDASHACMLHDYCYSTFDLPEDRASCDLILGSTIYSDCLRQSDHTVFQCGIVSEIYWFFVTWAGADAFKNAR